jgi:hypothetical protein
LAQPINVLIDPRFAAEGMTVADLKEQFEHNLRMRDMVAEVGRYRTRINAGIARFRGATGAGADTLARLEAISGKVETEPVRYGRPGIQQQVSYLAGMTSGADQKVGRDAIQRYEVLRKELDAIKAELDRVLGPGT